MVAYVADRHRRRRTRSAASRQFPYQYLAAYLNAEADVPQRDPDALGQAAEMACGNVPELPGPVVIGLDVSGSMSRRSRATAAAARRARCAASTWRPCSRRRCCAATRTAWSSRSTRRPTRPTWAADETILEPGRPAGPLRRRRHELLAAAGGGQPARTAIGRFAGCVLVSDMESWVGAGRHGSTGVMTEWQTFVAQPGASARRRLGRPEAGVHRPAGLHAPRRRRSAPTS